MSWLVDLAIGDGRSSIWLHPACFLYFKFSGSRAPALSEEWLKAPTASAQLTRTHRRRRGRQALPLAGGQLHELVPDRWCRTGGSGSPARHPLSANLSVPPRIGGTFATLGR